MKIRTLTKDQKLRVTGKGTVITLSMKENGINYPFDLMDEVVKVDKSYYHIIGVEAGRKAVERVLYDDKIALIVRERTALKEMINLSRL